jgi:hypothetical protein
MKVSMVESADVKVRVEDAAVERVVRGPGPAANRLF